jgi:hypothetical protein
MSILQTMRGLDLFREGTIAHYLSDVIVNKLLKILKPPAVIEKPARVKAMPKRPRSIALTPENRREVETVRPLRRDRRPLRMAA